MTTALSEAMNAYAAGQNVQVPDYVNHANAINNLNGNYNYGAVGNSDENDLSFDNAVDYVGKFATASIIAGVNELANTPANVANLFGAGIETTSTEDAISMMDSDLVSFYNDNKLGVDAMGFVLSSVIPGTAGIKVLNAGQKILEGAITAGKFGENTAKALRLLTPMKEQYLGKAIKEAMDGNSISALTNRNALKAIGSGLGQNVLEAAAFETAVAATMHDSPVLENQDFGDFVSNIAFSAGVFGLVGGALDAARIGYKVRGAVNASEQEARPWKFIPEQAKASDSYEKITLDFETLHKMPEIPTGLSSERTEYLRQAAATTKRTLENRIRKEFGTLANGDQDVAETMFRAFSNESYETKQTAFIGLKDMGRLTSSPADKEIRDFNKIGKKIAAGKATLKEIEDHVTNSFQTSYVKMWGENAGRMSSEVPKPTGLADTLKKGEQIKVFVNSKGTVHTGSVTAGSKSYKFTTNFNVNMKSDISKFPSWDVRKVTPQEAQARTIWASKLPPFEISAKSPLRISVNDIPLMEKLAREVGDDPTVLQHVTFVGKSPTMPTKSIQDFVGAKKYELALGFAKRKSPYSQDEIAALVNVKSASLSKEIHPDGVNQFSAEDIYALQDHAEKYTQKLIDKGLRSPEDGTVELWRQPQHVRMTYDMKPFEGVDNNVIDQMTIIKEQQKLYQLDTSKASANALGRFYDQLPDINSDRVYTGATPSGAGASYIAAASSDYGTLGAAMERAGQITSMATEEAKKAAREVFEPLLYRVANKQEASIEWSVLNSRVRGIAGTYGLNEAGDALEPLALIKWRKAAAAAREAGEEFKEAAPKISADMEPRIDITNQEVRDLIRGHIEVNGARTDKYAVIRSAQGQTFTRDPEAFYPIPVNPRDFPYYAMVTDKSITSGNHTGMIYAATADELKGYIAKMKQNPHMDVITGREAEQYYEAIGRWDYEKTLGDNYINTEIKRTGASANVVPATDPQKIANEFLSWHMDRESGLVREAVSAKYEVQFEELKRLGDEYTNAATSRFGKNSIANYFTSAVENPYGDMVKTALDIKKGANYPWHVNINTLADNAFSNMYRKVDELFSGAGKNPQNYAEIDATMRKYGYRGAAYDEGMSLFANSTATRGKLTDLVSKANGLLATVVLRWDALNAVNNAVSANVLLGAETNSLVRLINNGGTEAQQAFNKLTRINIPGNTQTVFSARKLISSAVSKFARQSKATQEELKWFEDNGFMTSISKQYRDNFDSISYNPAESFGAWESKLNKLSEKLRTAGDFGEKWTGNKLAEEFNRFVAADVMKQMTDVAVGKGLMDTKEQLAYINTFVNRTQGNYLASQRPMMFHGPIGQSIGLFQTYQFNLIQQLLRHVGEGRGKDAMTLLALQGTIHGMNGLPAFNAINTSIVGNASGNSNHTDLFDTVYGAAGKQGGDWLMYGMASNLLGLIHPDLKLNLYTRGDINPRHLTIVPTDPSQVPVVQATARFVNNMLETGKKLGAGGDVVGTILQGVEHNGISRPLAGLAQVLEAFDNPEKASYSTSSRGNVVFANDLFSFANVTRLAGGKPLDEAIALDATFRYKAYDLKDQAKRNLLGEAIKSKMIAGGSPTQEEMDDFAKQYAELGGKQDQFNKWALSLYKSANLSQAAQLQDTLNSRFNQSMQRLMGGKEIRDFTDPKRKLSKVPIDLRDTGEGDVPEY